MAELPLSVLDVVQIASGSTAGAALANSVDLAQQTERAGYRRYWVAEHHLNPGVAGTSPALVLSLIAGATRSIRVGSGAVQMGHHTPLSVVEQFGILDAVHPGRIDLGLGRSGSRRTLPVPVDPPPGAEPAPAVAAPAARARPARRTAGGLLLPSPFSFADRPPLAKAKVHAALLQQPGAVTPDYADQVADVVALLEGSYRGPGGIEAHAVPGEGADVELWILGSSGGASAEVAGERGLRFAAAYHVAPGFVLDAIEAYRAAFRPSPALARPYVAVSADVVVAATDRQAQELATGYGVWVRSVRTALSAIPFPSPGEARNHQWSDDDRALVRDRVDTQFVGSPATVADQLELLAAETGADELILTTMTHAHPDRVRSYQLLADEWCARRHWARAG